MSRSSSAAPASVAAAGLTLANPAPRWLYFAVFTISGFSGLIYESIWSHYLKLFLGHAAYAQSLVLMIFMGGLALGSWLAAKYSTRWRAPILYYAIVEAVIGVIALVFHPVFVSVSDTFFFSILPNIGNPALGNALKWTAAASLIVPQSVLLGMTFPLLSTGILRRYPDHPGGSLAMLYFTNSIGAAVGVLASGFWLIGLFGLPGTIFTAGLLNIVLALVVWVLVKLDPSPGAPPIQPTAAEESGRDRDIATLFFFAAGLTGAASFIYEVGWLRMLSLVLGATTHSFELMLSAFITGLALGGLWIKRRIDRIANPVRFAGWVQVLMGVLAVLTIPLYVMTFDWMAAMLSALQRTDAGYNVFNVFSHGIALLVMVPTTFLAGMTLPLFTYVLIRGRRGEQAIGRVYAANTLGAICGVLFAVHIGFPLLGLKFLIVFGAALDILLGLVLLHRSSGERREVRPLLQGAVVGASVLILVAATVDLEPSRLSSGVYRYRSAEMAPGTQVLFYEDGKTASISLFANDGQLTLATNGKPDASIQMNPQLPRTADEITMMMAAALPLAYNPAARRVANIGLGSGLTSHTLLADPGVERLDTIEIEAAMAIAAQGFGERVSRTFTDPRSAIHLEDAKTFFSLTNNSYDVIVAEPSNPWVSGVASLFSQEFYRSVKNYLAPDGIFVQWLQLYEFNDDLVLSVLKALTQEFSDYAIYNTDGNDILIVAKNGVLGQPAFERVFQDALAAELSKVGLRSDADFLVRKTGSKLVIDSLLANATAPANSDYFPFLDLRAGRARYREQAADSFRSWSLSPLPVLEMLGVGAFRHSQVVPDATFQRTQNIDRARHLYDSLTGGGGLAPNGAVADPTLTALRLLQASCDLTRFEANWSQELHALALASLSFLDAESATRLWDTVVPPACLEAAPAPLRAWIDLYRAAAARDARQIARTADALLAGDAAKHPSRMPYVVAAAMLGSLVDRDDKRVLDLWDEYRGSVAGLDASPEVRLILSVALSRTCGARCQDPTVVNVSNASGP